jgi:hypothetical protein
MAAAHGISGYSDAVAKVYLETSFFSACASNRTDVDSLSWKGRSLSLVGSASADRPNRCREKPSAEADPTRLTLAQLLIEQHVMPGPVKGDAIHVAFAAYHGMEYLLSWNVKHLANPNKRVHLARVLLNAGRTVPLIVTPDVLWESDDED